MLNQAFEEITALSKDVNNAKEQLQEYHSLLVEQQRIEDQLHEVNIQLRKAITFVDLANVFRHFLPLYNERLSIQLQFKELGEKPAFPVDGMKRFEQLLSNILPLEARLKGLNEKLKDNENRIASLQVDKKLLASDKQIRRFSQQYMLIQQAEEQKVKLNSKLSDLIEEIDSIKRRLGLTLESESALKLELTLSLKDQIRSLVQDYSKHRNRSEILLDQKQGIKENLETTRYKLNQYKELVMNADLKQELLEKVHSEIRSSKDENNKQHLVSKKNRIEKEMERHNQRNKKNTLIPIYSALSINNYSAFLWNLAVD